MKQLKLIAALLLGSATIIAEDFVLVKPDSFPRGHTHGRFGGLTRNFPLAIEPQFYGDSEIPGHFAFITKPFYIAATEITVAQFREFVEASGYRTDAEKNGNGILGWSPSEYGEAEKAPDWDAPRHDFIQDVQFTWKNPGFPSWNDAVAYCQWRSKKEGVTYRLPSEAEWEMAARAGTGDQFFFWGDEARNRIHQYANIGNVELERVRPLAAQRHWLLDVEKDPGDGNAFTAPVAGYEPNAWKLYDMSGNVFEWCQDYFNFNFYDQWEPENGPNPVAVDPVNQSEKDNDANELRVIRGGSWYTGPLAARSSARAYFDAPEAAAYIGFRVVREASGEEFSKYKNPHEAYLKNIRMIENAGGEFQPENGRARLSFRNKSVSAEVLDAIVAIPGLGRIRDVKMEPWTPEAWAKISNKEDLENLAVSGEIMGKLDFSPISQQKKLRDFHVSSPQLSDQNLRQLSGTESLHRLYISRDVRKLTDEGMKSFAGNRELQSIAVYDCMLTGTFVEEYTDNPYFLSLWLGYIEGDEGDPRGWSKAGSETLAKVRPGLLRLTLQKQPMGDEVLPPLEKLYRLEELDLSSCRNLTDDGIAGLLKKVPTIEKLTLNYTQAGNACVRLIPELRYLQALSIEGPNLSDSSFDFLSRGNCLHELSLRHTDSSRAAAYTAEGLGKLGRNPTLRKLTLESPVVFGPEIAELAASPSLEEVTLPVECLSADAVDVFAHIATLKKLNIRTRDEDAFAAWKNQLEEKKPGLSVTRR